MMHVPDNPVIRNCERTGWPDGKDPVYPRCPVCGRECGTIYYDADRTPAGCDACVSSVEAQEGTICPACGREHEVAYIRLVA